MLLTIDEAINKFCPIYNGLCRAGSCMAWEFDDTDEIDTDKSKLVSEVEPLYDMPVFKKSTTVGWCKLIDKEC